MDQEKHFDESIRRKLKEEDYTPPPFSDILPEKGVKGRGWLRGFLFGDLMLLLTFFVWSGASYFTTVKSNEATEEIESVAELNQSNTSDAVSHTGQNEIEHLSPTTSGQHISKANSQKVTHNNNSVTPNTDSHSTSSRGSYDLHSSNSRIQYHSGSGSNFTAINSSGLLALNDKTANYNSSEKFNGVNSFIEEDKSENREQTDYLTPLEFKSSPEKDYTLKSRDFSHTPMEFRSPFTIDILMIAEKTIGYNGEIPEVSNLYLDLKPKDGGFGAGILFGYHVYKNFGITSGLETVFREYNLNYSYSKKEMVMQPDSSFKEVTEILTNSRTVSEAEVRIPFMAAFSFSVKKKWTFEPAAGFAIKFKELNADMRGANEIPASILGSIEVSNGHTVTAAWMLSCQAGYQVGENTVLCVTPYYQAESLDKNSRQYYTGRAVSGIGLKAGMKFLFNKK